MVIVDMVELVVARMVEGARKRVKVFSLGYFDRSSATCRTVKLTEDRRAVRDIE